MSELLLGVGLFAVVLLVSALASGIVERAPLSLPIIFLGFGLALGWTNVLQLDPHHPVLEIVAVVSLTLALFLDAVKVQVDELKREWRVPFLTLGPGTILIILGTCEAAVQLLSLSRLEGLLIGAVLASTDPVVLRDVVRDTRLPRPVRRALSIEAGMNDLVVLPIVLVLIALLTGRASGAADWAGLLVRLLVVSPLVGLIVGGVGARLVGAVDRRFPIRLEFQALYGIGLVLAAYFAGQAVGGDGFLSAFFAGLAVTLFNISLCECFLDYGETTSEMMMLMAFILFGVVLSSLVTRVAIGPALLLAVIALVFVRPLVMRLVLQRAHMSGAARGFIGWFGPRGLNSLLLALLAVQGGVPRGEELLALTGVVVLVSVVLHGMSATPLVNWYSRRAAESVLAEEREGTFGGLFEESPKDVGFITPEDLAAMLQGPQPPIVIDVRARAHFEAEPELVPGSIRVAPDRVEEWAANRAKDRSVVAYCS
ncbi:MAG: cation:proton antiporter [Vicinamibacteraceae bacterium]